MNKNNNPVQDLIELNNRYERIETKTALIDKVSDEIEERKKIIFDKVVQLENKSIQLPLDIEGFIVALSEKIQERKKLRDEWGDLCKKRVRMDGYTHGTEKIIMERGDYSPNSDEKQEIELLIKQYEDISIKQENLLNRRIQIQEEEKKALNEIENILLKILE